MILTSCAALTTDATEIPGSDGECAAAKQNLYLKSGSALPQLINLLPGDTTGTPGATLAAQSRAISSDASRVYWTDGTDLYLREGSQTKQVDEAQGGGGTFQTATPDGSVAFFTKGIPPTTEETEIEVANRTKEEEEGVENPKELTTEVVHLWRYVAATNTATDLTPKGRVIGVLGSSDDGTFVYYVTKESLFSLAGRLPLALGHHDPDRPVGRRRQLPPDHRDRPGQRRRTPPALRLLGPRTDRCDTRNISTGLPSPAVFLFTAPGSSNAGIICVSCNPYGERPSGAASLPGASPNGAIANAPYSYKPRVLSADATRIFFDTFDALASQDTNGAQDVYQWEAFGTGSCVKPVGCVNLISERPRRRRRLDPRRLGRRLRRLLPHRRLPRPLRSRRQRRLRRPGRRWLPGSAEPGPLLRRRLPAAAARTRRPDARARCARKPSGNLPTPPEETAAEVQEEPDQTVRQMRQEKVSETEGARR